MDMILLVNYLEKLSVTRLDVVIIFDGERYCHVNYFIKEYFDA